MSITLTALSSKVSSSSLPRTEGLAAVSTSIGPLVIHWRGKNLETLLND